MEEQRLIQQALALGARQAVFIGVDRLFFDPAFRELCRANSWGSYGRCWACPPDAGDIRRLLNQELRGPSEVLAADTDTLELSTDSFFGEAYVEGMLFPEE